MGQVMERTGILIKLPLGLAAAVAVVLASWGGLIRIGWSLGSPPAVAWHGPLFALGLLGTVIGMERAVGLGKAWAWAAPALCAAAVAAMVAGEPRPASLLLAGGGVALIAVFVAAYRIDANTHIVVMGLGAVSFLLAAVGWASGAPIVEIVPAMAGFLVLTIAGERLELARLIGASAMARRILVALSITVLAGALIAALGAKAGVRVAAVGMGGIAIWLGLRDIARRTVRMRGITRYMATALLIGYAWLAFAAVLWLVNGLPLGRLTYDAGIHAFFLGFVMSMIFAHAPVIVPSLTRLDFPFRPWLWVPLAALHLTLIARIAGDLAGATDLRRWGGMLNVVSLAAFAAAAVASIIIGLAARRGVDTLLEEPSGPGF